MGKSDEVPRQRLEERPASLSQPLPREKLPKDLQKIVDKEDNVWEEIYDGTGMDTTDSNLRYAAYANRARTIMLSAQRYVAYTSDIGESFRPVAHPWLVRSAYAISWAYLIGDVSHEGYKAYQRNARLRGHINDEHRNATDPAVTAEETAASAKAIHIPAIEDYRAIMAQRAVFQSIASMGLPAFTIHSIVRYSGQFLKNAKNTKIRTWGPIGVSRHLRVVWSFADIRDSLVLQPSLHCHICSTSQSRRRSNGLSILASKLLAVSKLSAQGTRQAGIKH
jgi:mitochondrial fission process protein 1